MCVGKASIVSEGGARGEWLEGSLGRWQGKEEVCRYLYMGKVSVLS